MTQNEASLKYGPIVDGKWADEAKWMISLIIPANAASCWLNTANNNKPTNKIYCNKDLAQPLLVALAGLTAANLLTELKTFDGCFAIRSIRGLPDQQSAHSYGLAIDINAATNQLGAKPSLTPEFIKCFTDAGFTWGGNFHRIDGMHFSIVGF